MNAISPSCCTGDMTQVDSLHVDRIVAGFGEALRLAGLEVPVGCLLAFRDAVCVLGVDRQHDVYWAGRSTLVHRPEDHELFDEVFFAYWADRPAASVVTTTGDEQELTVGFDDGDDQSDDPDADADDDGEPVDLVLRWSAAEVLREKDFSLYTEDELDEARRVMGHLRLATALRSSRRQRRARHERGKLDLRRTVRDALRTEGETVTRASTVSRQQPRRLILLLDISGSMEAYARALLRFVHAAVVGRRRVEAFALGTRLTRLTRELSSRDPDEAFAAATGAVDDWSGGTRLGPVLRDFNDRWGVRGMARGAIVVVLSDGWDRGEPELLAEQMQRLARVTNRIVWVNPLKAGPGYQPLAAGMAAALPFVDEFIEGHNIVSLEHLADVVAA